MEKRDSLVLKGIAIASMLCFHVFSQGGHMGELHYLLSDGEEKLKQFSMGCQICVSIYVFITSYGIAKSMRERHIYGALIGKNIVRRYVELMKAFWAVYILALIPFLYKGELISIYYVDNRVNCIKNMCIDAMGLASKFGTPTINSSWWFMSMAIRLIVIVPLFELIFEHLGTLFGFLFSVITMYFLNFGLVDYYFVVIVGVALANSSFFEVYGAGIMKLQTKHIFLKGVLFIEIVISIFIIYFRDNLVSDRNITNPIIVVWLAVVACTISSASIYLTNVFSVLGKHSTNMWLVHTFIYYTFAGEIVFAIKIPLMCYIVLITFSLAISLVIEIIKKWIHYDFCFNYILGEIYKLMDLLLITTSTAK